MGTNHLIKENDIEPNPTKSKKLIAFREKAKKMNGNSEVTRIYAEFDSLEDFKEKLQQALRDLTIHLHKNHVDEPKKKFQPILKQRPFWAIPAYGGSHAFIGRQEELNRLNEWASSDNQNSVFLFEAMGGMGKSMLTWEWVTKHAQKASNEWVGIFWYSFYEQGANFNDFCLYALAYITLQPIDYLNVKNANELSDILCKHFARLNIKNFNELCDTLLKHLSEKPYLFVLDGLERLLVCYHRYDATDMRDDNLSEADDCTRNPCACIRPADDIFLSKLATKAYPSKILITSRLKPNVFINRSNILLPGIDYCLLTGLNNNDAIDFFKACGIRGTREDIQRYIKSQCDNHPLVMGALAGIINQYVPDRGNFDQWFNDEEGAGKLNLQQVDLTQRKHHIVEYSIEILSPICKEILSFLSFFSQGMDYKSFLDFYIENKKMQLDSVDIKNNLDFKKDFDKAISTLEERGLLQRKNKIIFDLHPVIRSVAMSMLSDTKKREAGIQVIDYFNKNNVVEYEKVENIQEIFPALNIVSTHYKINEFNKVMGSNFFPLLYALARIEAYKEIIEITNPLISFMLNNNFSFTTENSYIISSNIQAQRFMNNYEVNSNSIKNQINTWLNKIIDNSNMSDNLQSIMIFIVEYEILCSDLEKLASVERADTYLQKIFELIKSEVNAETQTAFEDSIRIDKIRFNSHIGNYEVVNEIYSQCVNKNFDIRYHYYISLIKQDILSEEDAEFFLQEAKDKKEMRIVRKILRQQGLSYYCNKNYKKALEKLSQSVELSRNTNSFFDDYGESLLLLTQFHLGELADPHRELENLLSKLQGFHFLPIAEFWWELGEEEKAREFAIKQYRHSWGEGEPYANTYWLTKTRNFMQEHNMNIPKLPVYDPSKVRKESWEEPLLQLLKEKALLEEAKQLADFSVCKTLDEKERNLNAVKRMIEEHPNLQEITKIYSEMLLNYEENLTDSLIENENIQEKHNLREIIISKYNFPETHTDEFLATFYKKYNTNQCINILPQIGYKCYPQVKVNDEIIPFIAIADDEILIIADVVENNMFDEIDNYDFNRSVDKLNKSRNSMQKIFTETLEDIIINIFPLIITQNEINITDESIRDKIFESNIKFVCLDKKSDNYILNYLPDKTNVIDQENLDAYKEYIEAVIKYAL
jgi:hypothetical protein